MKRLLPFLAAYIIVLSSCVKHTEITYESLDLADSYWIAYEVDNKELSQDKRFMFYFSKAQNLQILFLNPNNNKYESQYSFYYSVLKNNDSAIFEGYFLSSAEFKDATLHYKRINSSNNNIEFKLSLFPDSDPIVIKMNRLKKQ